MTEFTIIAKGVRVTCPTPELAHRMVDALAERGGASRMLASEMRGVPPVPVQLEASPPEDWKEWDHVLGAWA